QVDMMYQSTEIPDIRYSSLTSPHTEDETETPGWTDAEIARAIREGIEPDGNRIKSPMPRWNMTDAEISDVIDYLKELDTR
ncbi:MAG: cytochrome c, partial [Coriobacteriia bacterium]|nr:cytochrome c [Coriobacteriia bacterium]